jgi:hypothetical protein
VKTKNGFGHVYLQTRRRLHQQRNTLAALYEAAKAAGARQEQNTSALMQASLAKEEQWGALGDVVISPLVAHMERLETDAHICDIYAAAVILVLDDTLGTAYSEFKERGGTPRDLSRVQTVNVLDAGGNNFRHYEEWGRNAWADLSSKARANIITIAEFLGLPFDDEQRRFDGNRWFGQIMAWRILERLGPDSYQTIEIAVRDCLEEMLIALGLHDSALAMHARAAYD